MSDVRAKRELYDAMREDHRRLDALFEELLDGMHVNDAALAQKAWAAFERQILTHLEVEEEAILPLFEREEPEETAAILAEHVKIRALLAEFGVSLDIHLLREETVAEFIRSLRAHAAREESLLYGWADSALEEGSKASILERLGLAGPSRGQGSAGAEEPSPRAGGQPEVAST